MLAENLLQHSTIAKLAERFSGAIVDGHDRLDQPTVTVDPGHIVEICRFLKDELKFVRLSGITCVDWHPADQRFEVVYHLHAIDRHERFRVKTRVSASVDSVCSVWRAANWYEREVFDLFGVEFRNHPDLRRILMPEDWEGHPLRKDFPIHGHKYSYRDA